MQSFLLKQMLPFFLPLLTGFLTTQATDLLKRASSWVDNQSAGVKQILAGGIAFGLTQLAPLVQNLCPAGTTCDLGNLNVSALVAFLVALALKHSQQIKAA